MNRAEESSCDQLKFELDWGKNKYTTVFSSSWETDASCLTRRSHHLRRAEMQPEVNKKEPDIASLMTQSDIKCKDSDSIKGREGEYKGLKIKVEDHHSRVFHQLSSSHSTKNLRQHSVRGIKDHSSSVTMCTTTASTASKMDERNSKGSVTADVEKNENLEGLNKMIPPASRPYQLTAQESIMQDHSEDEEVEPTTTAPVPLRSRVNVLVPPLQETDPLPVKTESCNFLTYEHTNKGVCNLEETQPVELCRCARDDTIPQSFCDTQRSLSMTSSTFGPQESNRVLVDATLGTRPFSISKFRRESVHADPEADMMVEACTTSPPATLGKCRCISEWAIEAAENMMARQVSRRRVSNVSSGSDCSLLSSYSEAHSITSSNTGMQPEASVAISSPKIVTRAAKCA